MSKILELANVKLGSVVSNVMGVTGRTILDAMIGSEDDPEVLAGLLEFRRRHPTPFRLAQRRGSAAFVVGHEAPQFRRRPNAELAEKLARRGGERQP